MRIGPYETGRVYQGDCLELMREIPIESIDAVITDPPYGVNLTARATKHSVRRSSSNYQDDEQYWIEHILPRIKYALDIAKRAVITPGARMLQLYPRATEIGCVFQPNGAGMSRWGFTCMHPVLFYGKDPLRGGHPNSISATNWLSEKGIDHPCPKPVEFMRWLVGRATLPGELVLDPFAGSGTTGIACAQLDREYLGFEIDPHWAEVANTRISAARQGLSVRDLGAGQRSLFGELL